MLAASDVEVAKLDSDLNLESEQAATNMPPAQEMMDDIARSGPPEAHSTLARFKDNSWKALTSYAHAGIHPLRRHTDGYPTGLVHGVLCNTNGLRFCRDHHLEPSMSRRGNCWDNAVAESFFSRLKKERIKKRIYKTRDLARADVFDYIEVFYNRTRRHGHLGGVSPEAKPQRKCGPGSLSPLQGPSPESSAEAATG